MVFINMAKNIGPDGDSAYFSANSRSALYSISTYYSVWLLVVSEQVL